MQTDNSRDGSMSDLQKRVLIEKATEAPFTGALLHNSLVGDYECAQCGSKLFNSSDKFDSGSGWPSFSDVITTGAVRREDDTTHGMLRSEVLCANCGGHLGHVFDDGPAESTGLRYCINSAALNFTSSDKKITKRGDDGSTAE